MEKSVLFIVQNLPVPQDHRIWMEAKILKKNGFLISIICPRKKDQKKKENLDGINIFRYLAPPKSKGYFSYLWEYIYSFFLTLYLTFKVHFKYGFRIIHSANPPDFFFIIALLFKPLGVKFIYDQHDLMPEMFLARFQKNSNHLFYKILIYLEKLSFKFSNVHISTCESGLKKVLERLGNSKKSFIVKTIPDKEILNQKFINLEIVRQVSEKFKYLCSYVGVMGPQDGVDKLLRSIDIIINQMSHRDIGFVLMGDGDDFERLKKMAKELEIDENVIFTGWADGQMMSAYLFNSHLGLMPEPKNEYTDNSLHNKILEYMSCGLPVVSYDLKEARKAADKAAVFVKNNDEKEFAQSIVNLISRPDVRKRMSELGKQRVQEFFQKNTFEKSLLKAYSLIINKKIKNQLNTFL